MPLQKPAVAAVSQFVQRRLEAQNWFAPHIMPQSTACPQLSLTTPHLFVHA